MKAALLTGNPANNWTYVKDIPVPKITSKQILVKTVAYAANPTDWKHCAPPFADNVSGSDASGTVVEVGSEVSGFTKGDVVSITLHGGFSKENSAFAEYVAADPGFTIKYPEGTITDKKLSVGEHPSGPIGNYEQAASVTLGLSTVVLSFAGNLDIPSNLSNQDKAILIWGGATATGVLAVQMAKVAFGLRVYTTASAKNHAFLKLLGADLVFDYNDKDVIDQIKKAAGGSIAYGLDTIASPETFQQLYDATAGSKHVELDNLLMKKASDIKTDESRLVGFHQTLMYGATGDAFKIWGAEFPTQPVSTGKYLDYWHNQLPKYIAKLRTANLKVLAPGLESVNESLQLLHDNKVSGQKVVFRAE